VLGEVKQQHISEGHREPASVRTRCVLGNGFTRKASADRDAVLVQEKNKTNSDNKDDAHHSLSPKRAITQPPLPSPK